MVEVAADRRAMRLGRGNTLWSAVTNILVRFGVAEFVHYYTDGPAPNEGWIMDDVDRYLRGNRRPPPGRRHRPIFSMPPPAYR